jgi:hypothetical protein
MITKKISAQIAVRQDGYPCPRYDYYGISSDTKPVDEANNAESFYEMDTRKVFMFDAENRIWLEQ